MNNRVNSYKDLTIDAWYIIKIDGNRNPVIGKYVGNHGGFLKFLRDDSSIFNLPEELFDNVIIERPLTGFELAPGYSQRLLHFVKVMLANIIRRNSQMCTASQILYEACHFCDISLNEIVKPPTSKERAIRKFGWKLDTASLLWASGIMRGALKDFRTRQFLDDVRECEQLYGDYRHYDDLLWGWSDNSDILLRE